MRQITLGLCLVLYLTVVWDATFDAVKAANSAEGFTGEDGEIILKFDSKAIRQ